MKCSTRLAAGGRWPADVDLWQVRIPAAAGAQDWPHLDAGERERAARYRQPGDRIRFALTRSRLRELLAGHLGEAPATLRFVTSPWGRPELVGGGGLSFNVSHGGEQALIAISAARCVGVDIERIDPILDWQALTGMVCTDAELQAILAQPRRHQRPGFFHCWTAKEAVLKACGLGIGAGLRALSLPPVRQEGRDDAGGRVVIAGQPLDYHWLGEFPGYSACIAYGEPCPSKPSPNLG